MERVNNWWDSYQFVGSHSFVLAQKLKAIKGDLKKKKGMRRNLGMSFCKKNLLMADLRELEVVEDSRPLSVEEKSKKELTIVGLDKLILLEEISWRQKSRA